ncbi:MAG: ribonuclease HII [Nitrospiraceae bacterium]|nr:ribonuclease HII [Nitrospiraceae bacterium]MDA8090809.1 ribonuclease HII [Nitrospiraceae bacterium]
MPKKKGKGREKPVAEPDGGGLDFGQYLNAVDGAIECGCDEAGRGSAAAEVYVAAVILDPGRPIEGLADSKLLTAARREELACEIKLKALSWCIEKASLEEVEKLNVLHATLLAFERAVRGLNIKPGRVLIDGDKAPKMPGMQVLCVIRGDRLVPAISAASILAKVARDEAMMGYHLMYPGYGFDVHKGYLTKEHLQALSRLGPCPIHRKTYRPVERLIESQPGSTGLF